MTDCDSAGRSWKNPFRSFLQGTDFAPDRNYGDAFFQNHFSFSYMGLVVPDRCETPTEVWRPHGNETRAVRSRRFPRSSPAGAAAVGARRESRRLRPARRPHHGRGRAREQRPRVTSAAASACSGEVDAGSPTRACANERILAANRANAARSTGPRSRAGKAAVARNALRHGLSLPVPSWRCPVTMTRPCLVPSKSLQRSCQVRRLT